LPILRVFWLKKSSFTTNATAKTRPRIFRGAIASKLHPRRLADLEEAPDRLFGKVDDTIRDAARMASGRRLAADRLAETAHAGLTEIFVKKAG
jgi:hypothetical protein